MEPVSTPVTGTYTIVLDGQSTYKGKATVALWTVGADPTAPATPGGAAVPLALTPGQNGTVIVHRHGRPPRERSSSRP